VSVKWHFVQSNLFSRVHESIGYDRQTSHAIYDITSVAIVAVADAYNDAT